MLAAAGAMWRGKSHLENAKSERVALHKVILSGVGVGFLTGVLGVGGRFLIVPALGLFAGLPMQQAVGTSLLTIAINCAAGFAGHVSAARLQKAFAVFIALVAVFLLVKNLGGIK